MLQMNVDDFLASISAQKAEPVQADGKPQLLIDCDTDNTMKILNQLATVRNDELVARKS
jgi:hypothetical protein